jgi:hypothetical protein
VRGEAPDDGNAEMAALRPTRGEPVTSTRRGGSEFASRIGRRRHRRPSILIEELIRVLSKR